MQLKDANVGDRVRVWYDGTRISDLINEPNSHPLEATIGLLDDEGDVALVWKPGEYTPNAWSLATSGYSWAPPLIAAGYEKGFWADNYCECELISSAAQTSNPVYSREDLLGYPIYDVGVATPMPETSTHSIPTPVPQEKPFDFDAYNYGTHKR